MVLVFLQCQNANDATTTGDAPKNDGKGGSLATFTLKGKYLYTVDYNNLSVFHIADENNPVKVNQVNIGFAIETLFNFKEYLFIGSRNAMYIYDVSNPELPKKLSIARHFTACDPVVANDTHAYVTIHSGTNCRGGGINQLKVYDIKDLKKPSLIHTRGLTKPKGLALYENYLLICDEDVKIFDITNPEKSTYVGSIPVKFANDLIIRDHHLFIIGDKSIEQYQIDKEDVKKSKKLSSFTF